jgi:signal transduction histidine kinase
MITKPTRSIRTIFTAAIGLVFLLSVLSYTRINSLIQSAYLVNNTTQVILKLEKMFSEVKEAETGVRAYFITSDYRFLEFYYKGIHDYPKYLKSLDTLTKDNPVQQQNLHQIEKYAKRKVFYMEKMRKLSQRRIPNADELFAGKLIMDSLRVQVDNMIEIENNLMGKRAAELDTQTTFAPVMLFLFSIVAMMILIMSFWQLNKSLNKNELAKQELKQKNSDLEKTNKELASFLYISSHDLQEPLRKIQMFTKLINEDKVSTLSNEGKHYFSRIENSAERMQQLIRDLIALSQTSTVANHFERTDLNAILEQVKQDLNEKIISSNATIEYDPLPYLNVIPFQFKQLFTNLISNSIKYSKPGIAPHIMIRSSMIEGIQLEQYIPKPGNIYLLISIIDNGIGFEPQFNEHIFELFQRLHGRNEYEGTGIGLAICKKIVENHHGLITASGENEKGAIFRIYIPVN